MFVQNLHDKLDKLVSDGIDEEIMDKVKNSQMIDNNIFGVKINVEW